MTTRDDAALLVRFTAPSQTHTPPSLVSLEYYKPICRMTTSLPQQAPLLSALVKGCLP